MADSQSHTRRSKAILFDRYVTPLLTEHGFVRDRRTYRRLNDLGDAVMVDFQPSSAATRREYAFYVNLCAIPRRWMDWIGTPDRTRPSASGPTTWRLRGQQPPPVPGSTAVQVALLLDHGMTDELAALLADLDDAERGKAVYGPDEPDPNRRSPLSLWAEQWIHEQRGVSQRGDE